jgi:ADP-L-glycero-D-manno-heptose 6-epimerase
MIIVTGAAGFIGSAFVGKLNSEGVRDILVVDNLASTSKWKNLVKKSFREYLHKDQFLSMLKSDNLPSSVDAIVHLGACSATTESNMDYLMVNNVKYTQTLAEFAIARDIRFVYASSAATYGDGDSGYDDTLDNIEQLQPLNGYGYSKHLFDLWAKRLGLFNKIVGLKFFNVYGPNEYYKGEMASVVWKAFNTIRDTGAFSLFKSHRPDYKDGEQKRDFVYVKDCCDVMWWLLNNPKANGLLNLGSGKARTWNDLVTSVFTAMNKPVNIQYVDMPPKLINQYQYFTEAPIERLIAAGYNQKLHQLEEGIHDYVTNHLLKRDIHY